MATVCWYALHDQLDEDTVADEVARDLAAKQKAKAEGKGGVTNRITHMLKK